MKRVSSAPHRQATDRVEAEDTTESNYRHDAPHPHDDDDRVDAQRDEDAPPPDAWS